MLRWMDGFEQYGTVETHMLEGVGGAAAWSQVDSDWLLSSSNPATGTYHMRQTATFSGGTSLLRRALGQSKQISGMGYRFSLNDLPSFEEYTSELDSQQSLLEFRDVTNTRQFRINVGTEGSVHAVRGTTSLGRSDPCIASGGYHHFESKGKIDNTTGYVEVRINEVTVLNLTGIDTQSGAAETSQFAIGEFGDVTDPGAGFGFMDSDDYFAWDDDATDPENTVVDFIGDKGCYYVVPDADTATSDWTINGSATAYGALDEVPPNGTDYLDDTTGTARTIVQAGALPGNVAEVIAWMPVIYARKEDSGAVGLRGGVVVGASESYTPTNSPSTTYAYMEPGPKTIDPDSGVAWDNTTVPDLLIERTA